MAEYYLYQAGTLEGGQSGKVPVSDAAPLPVTNANLLAAAALADAAAANPTTSTVGAVPLLMNATTVDRQRAVVAGLNSTGTGIAAAGMVGQFDDASTTAVTENQFAIARISSRRAQLVEGVASGTPVLVDYSKKGDTTLATQSATLLASASRTTTQTSSDLSTKGWRGLHVILDVTDVAASPSVTVTINGKDPASGKYYLLLSGAAVVTAVTNVYKVAPGITATANVSASDVLPATIQVVVTANNANAGTYSLGMSFTE
jgi:hypothetical protein